jgi:2-polyprenyl-3-methyl-5-hydroxy-6-metoxy-1,4-benzoquinol methylase
MAPVTPMTHDADDGDAPKTLMTLMTPTTPSTSDELAAHGIAIESASCAFCGTGGGTPIVVGRDRQHRLPGRFTVVRCETCGVMRTDPRPTIESIGRYYPADYAPYRVGPAWWDRHRWLAALMEGGWTRMPASPPGRLLELGTSTGVFLERMQQRGWEVFGIESSDTAARDARARTHRPVEAIDLNRAGEVDRLFATDAFAAESFDVVCAWMVIEHLHDPIAMLRRAFDWLTPGGWLAISVPDAGSWMFRAFGDAWFCLDVPRHLYHFSARTLHLVLTACGFRDITMTRPGTVGDLVYSVADRLDDRGWLARETSRRLLAPWPMRALTTGLGLVARVVPVSSCLVVTARKPAIDRLAIGSDRLAGDDSRIVAARERRLSASRQPRA